MESPFWVIFIKENGWMKGCLVRKVGGTWYRWVGCLSDDGWELSTGFLTDDIISRKNITRKEAFSFIEIMYPQWIAERLGI